MASSTPTAPFQKVYIDFCGPIVRSSTGSRYVLVILDAFSKWIQAIPCTRATASVTCKKLVNLWCTFGPPQMLVSDNATVFRSDLLHRMSLAWGIKQVFTAPYQPTSNMVERSMRDLKASLSIMIRTCANDHRDWDRFLPFFIYSHNSNISEVTQLSPAKIFIGRELPKPLDRQWDIERYLDPDPHVDIEQIHNKIQQAHQKVKQLYDLKHPRQHPFKEGQTVLQRCHQIAPADGQHSQKFIPKWSEPRRILRFTTPSSCILENLTDPTRQYRTHVSQLKPFFER